MSTGYIIALSIVVVAIVIFVVGGIVAFKRVKPTLNNFNNLSKNIEDTANRYGKDGERIQQKVEVIQERIELTQMNAEQKLTNFDDLKQEFDSLSDSLLFLKEHGVELSKDNQDDLVKNIKEDGPKYLNILQGTAKRTFNKQKARYS